MAGLFAVRTSDTKEIEHPQRMAGLEKLQRGARRRDEGPLWAGFTFVGHRRRRWTLLRRRQGLYSGLFTDVFSVRAISVPRM